MKTLSEKMNKTIKELQKIAKNNGFYLCPETVWNEMAKTIMYKDSEITRLKKGRDQWKKSYKTLAEDTKLGERPKK